MKRATVNTFLLCCAVLMAIAGCGTACRCCRPAAASPASAPERVEIDGHEYVLYAHAWRDFQPVAPPDGQPLVVSVRVSEPTNGLAIPASFPIDRVWVLNGKKQWSAPPEPGTNRSDAVVRGGPKWDPGTNVEVVVQLRQGKQTWLLRHAGVEIKRTD